MTDAALKRIEKMGHDQSRWKILYRDLDTGQLWDVKYRKCEMHGAGPVPWL